jgi:predicted nuclease with TOPRIM domain
MPRTVEDKRISFLRIGLGEVKRRKEAEIKEVEKELVAAKLIVDVDRNGLREAQSRIAVLENALRNNESVVVRLEKKFNELESDLTIIEGTTLVDLESFS